MKIIYEKIFNDWDNCKYVVFLNLNYKLIIYLIFLDNNDLNFLVFLKCLMIVFDLNFLFLLILV